jgi:hypothetical protein
MGCTVPVTLPSRARNQAQLPDFSPNRQMIGWGGRNGRSLVRPGCSQRTRRGQLVAQASTLWRKLRSPRVKKMTLKATMAG